MTTNAQRRSVLLAQHARLRVLIAELRGVARSALSGRAEALGTHASALLAAVSAFGAELTAHLAAEEELLGPVLEHADCGPLRLAMLRVEHAHQRAVLGALRANRDPPLPIRELARRAWKLTSDVLDDMEAEDRELLGETVLRDPPAVTDQTAV